MADVDRDTVNNLRATIPEELDNIAEAAEGVSGAGTTLNAHEGTPSPLCQETQISFCRDLGYLVATDKAPIFRIQLGLGLEPDLTLDPNYIKLWQYDSFEKNYSVGPKKRQIPAVVAMELPKRASN
ncbi:MAG: hypothetical protein LBR11_00790 [Deltaproteobacteria bacterium]|nr:hypothetical protein [Deltaproteobacteria bacterium]